MTDIDFTQFALGNRVKMVDPHFTITGVIDVLDAVSVQVWDADNDHAHRAIKSTIMSLEKIDHEEQPDDALDYAPEPEPELES